MAAVFFLRYSTENGWLSPPVRMAIGLLVGAALLVACELKGQNYRITANAMDAAGVGTLFATCFAAYTVWHIIPASLSIALLMLVTAVAVLLSIRRNSQFIALLGLAGGFLTPVLLSSGENRPFGLFGYLLLLNVALCLVAYRQGWHLLVALSVGFTTLYQWGWLARFVLDDADELPIALGVFLLFPIVWWVGRLLALKRMRTPPDWVSQLLIYAAALPLLLGVVMALVPAFGEHPWLLFAYLFIVDAGLLVLGHYQPKSVVGLLAAVATCLTWVVWGSHAYDSATWPSVVWILLGFVGLFLGAAVWHARVRGSRLHARFASVVLLGVVPIFIAVEPATANPLPVLGATALMFAAIAGVSIALSDGVLYYLAVPFVVAAEAAWFAEHLNEDRILAALGINLVFALAFVAVPILARKLSRPLLPARLGSYVPLLGLLLLFFLAAGTAATRGLWLIGVMLVVLNVAALIEARASRSAWAAWLSLGLSWLIIVCWWGAAVSSERLVAALAVVFVMVLLSVGGPLWLRLAIKEPGKVTRADHGPLLGLVGHLFLLFVATQPSLSASPWALFAVALLLDLALLFASLYLRRALFASAACCLSLLVLALWSAAASAPLPQLLASEVALLAALVVLGLSEIGARLGKRVSDGQRSFATGRDITLLAAQALLVVLASYSEPPRHFYLLLAQTLIGVRIIYSGRSTGQHTWVLGWWLGTCLATLAWYARHFDATRWPELLLLAFQPLVILTYYPIHCFFRPPPGRWPFVAALAGSLSCFGFGYLATRVGPLAAFQGGLPLCLAFVCAGLLLFCLRVVEPRAPRDIGRLALVAAAALGYVTAAIPLQLQNEWLTVAWALETAALGWLYLRLKHVGLLAAALGLAAAVTVRLSLNPAVLVYHERSTTPILSFYLYTYGTSVVSLFVSSWFLRGATAPRYVWLEKTAALQQAFATLLAFICLNIEIADFYSEGTNIEFRFSSTLAQDLTYTLGWVLFALVLLGAGIVLRARVARIAALALLTVTIAKCFLHDLWRLGGLYRVGSFVGLALSLAFVAILMQRFVRSSPEENEA
jgi:hypothetical protein